MGALEVMRIDDTRNQAKPSGARLYLTRREDDRDDFASRWRAVTERDARKDGAFVFAVRSTGIYCRPSCPSRKPRRAQVVFFRVPEDAERKGFRPCRRCRPANAEAMAHDPLAAAVGRV